MEASTSGSSKQQIAQLPPDTVDLLRSTMVIPDLATAFRELLHNAIDALATEINILVEESISINDNGRGFSLERFKVIGTRYVTQEHADIRDRLRFGTRGEALASMANLGQLALVRWNAPDSDGSQHGTCVTLRQGKPVEWNSFKKSIVSFPLSTSVRLSNLFFNIPVRNRVAKLPLMVDGMVHTFRTLATQFTHVKMTIQFNVQFERDKSFNLHLKSPGHGQLAQIYKSLTAPLHNDLAQKTQLIDFSLTSQRVVAYGFISAQHGPNKRDKWIFVNYVQLNDVFLGIMDHGLRCLEGDKPNTKTSAATPHSYLVHILIEDPDVELGVHQQPQGPLIKLITDILREFINKFGRLRNEIVRKRKRDDGGTAAVAEPLRVAPIQSSVATASGQKAAQRQGERPLRGEDQLPAPDLSLLGVPRGGPGGGPILNSDSYRSPSLALRVNKPKDNWLKQSLETMPPPGIIPLAPPSLLVPPQAAIPVPYVRIDKDILQSATVIGQVDRKLIACFSPANDKHTAYLFLVDQHAADERIRVERILGEIIQGFVDNNIDTHAPSCQLRIELSNNHQAMLRDPTCAALLARWGINLKPSSDSPVSACRVLSVPAVLKIRLSDPRSDVLSCIIQDFLSDWAHRTVTEMYVLPDKIGASRARIIMPRAMKELVNSMACRGAIMLGDELSNDQAKDLIQRLSKTDFPFICAHGRPSVIPMTTLPGSAPSSRSLVVPCTDC